MNDMPEKVIEAAVSQIGSPYVFGARGEPCTPSNRKRRERSDHPTIKSKCQVLSGSRMDCNGCVWQGDKMFDCRGFTYWCLLQVNIRLYGQGATTQYSTGINWLERGNIADMPECVCCVFVSDGKKKTHTGLYIGNGETIECSSGVQRKPLANKWTHYAIPAGLYTQEEIYTIREAVPKPKLICRKSDKGDEVKYLQSELNYLGYDCGVADGIFGSKTQAAVKAFQQDHGLTPDGIVGTNTWAALGHETNIEMPFYTLKIPNLSIGQANELLAQYPDAMFVN